MRLAAVRNFSSALALPLACLTLAAAAALVGIVVGFQRPAQAQTVPTVSVSCPDRVAAVESGDAPGAVECTFSVSPSQAGGLTVRYEVAATGSRSLAYQQSVVVTGASETDSVWYLSEAAEITVRLLADAAYSVGSPSEATIAVGTATAYSGAGLHVNEAGALDGYVLLTTPFHGSFYLVDNEGRKAYSWNAAGALGKLLDNGNLITGHNRSNVAEISPDGTAAWKYQTKNQHHDVIKLANGNYLFISSEYYTTAQAIAAGANPDCLDLNGLEVDSIIEMQPVGPSGGSIVWKWNVWDHLIQDFDSTKDNYGVVADHPELIDINYGLCQIHAGSNVYIKDPHHLTHLNAIDYNASLDQILITSRHFSEVWVIDHSTTTTQAASGSGGDSNMGGNLLYRYGNPRTHQNGSKSDQRLFFPHNAHWISSGLPGAGNILIYNNGHEHPGFLRNYASVDELAFPSSEHTYLRAGDGFMQPTLLWTHRLAEHTWIMSSAQRLPNGNTLITEGNHARISEVTPDGTVVWHYSNPLHPGKGILTEGSPPLFDSGYWTYRSYKYAADHPGIAALTLVPVADRTSLAVKCTGTVTPTSDDLIATVRGYHNNNKTSSNYDQSWFRVLISFGVESSDTLESFTVAEARAKENTSDDWMPIREELERRRAECVSSLTPVVSIAAGPSVTEGTAASFTLTAVPPPSVGMTVNVSVTSAGGFAAAATTTVTIPTSGTATLSVDTLDDDIHESDGSVTVTVDSGTGYSVDSVAAATVSVSDDEGSCTVTAPSDDLIQLVRGYHDSNRPKSGYNQNWLRVLIAFGAETSSTLEPFTAAEARNDEQVWDGWTPIRQELERLEQEAAQCATPAVPVVSIAAGGDVTEGGNAVFTLTADPVPAAQFDVTVTVATSGSYGVTAGTRTVTIPTSGTATLTLATTDDSTDEANGTITATLVDGAAYDLGSTATATVNIADNETPAVSITSAGDVTEGGNAVFTLTADPVPHASLDVTVTIATSGSYGVTAGTRTVTIPTSGTATLTLATTDDSTDEANGTITATLVDGAAYDLDTTATATINIADNDNSTPATPVVSIAAGGGITEGGNAVFTLVAAPAPAAQFDVTVTVATSGSYGVTAGTRTVTIPTSGTATLTLATTDDSTDEANGTITATLVDGAAYDLSSTTTATVNIADNETPVVSITSAGDVTEGGNAVFTLVADPAPHASLDVTVTVTTSGSYGVTAGARTVTIPTSGTATLTLATTDDNTDEANGTITATLVDGAAYDLGSASSATVAVSDNDDTTTVLISVNDGSGDEGDQADFTVTLSQAAPHRVTVRWAAHYGGAGRNALTGEFWRMSGTMVFQPGETTKSGFTFLDDDNQREGDEVFLIKLSRPTGAVIERGTATMTIIDDD